MVYLHAQFALTHPGWIFEATQRHTVWISKADLSPVAVPLPQGTICLLPTTAVEGWVSALGYTRVPAGLTLAQD